MAVVEASIAAVLREWARQQPDAPAYTYIDCQGKGDDNAGVFLRNPTAQQAQPPQQ